MPKLSFKTTLYLTFGAVAVLALLLNALVVMQNHAQEEVQQRQKNRYHSYLLADELRQSSDDLTRFARTYVVTGDPKYEQMYNDVLAIRNGQKPRPAEYQRIYWDFYAASGEKPRADETAVALQELMRQAGFTEAEFAKLRQAQANSDALVKTEVIAMNAVKGRFNDGNGNYTVQGKPDLELARSLMHSNEYHKIKAGIMRPIDEFFVLLDQRTEEAVRQGQREVALRSRLVSLLLVLLAIMVVLGAWLARRATLNAISGTVNAISATATEIAATITQHERTASQQAAAANQTSATITELSASSRQSAEQAANASAAAEKASAAAAQGGATTRQAVAAMNDLKDKITAMADQILRLGEQTGQIGSIATLVKDLSGQINMLALNAAVEAARAGEHGKGFAVVASEVRKLADQSKKSAEQATTLVGDIQKATNSSIMMTEEGSRNVIEATQLAQKVAALFADLSGMAVNVNESVKQVMLNAKQQSAAFTQIEEATNSIATGAKETADGISQTKIGVQKLNEAAENLRAIA